jgi:hypothetical protein
MTAHIITFPSTANGREFWRAESQRLGSDWISIGETVTAIMRHLASICSSNSGPRGADLNRLQPQPPRNRSGNEGESHVRRF